MKTFTTKRYETYHNYRVGIFFDNKETINFAREDEAEMWANYLNSYSNWNWEKFNDDELIKTARKFIELGKNFHKVG